MGMESGLYWHNFKTGEYEYLDESPTDYSDYIPQSDAAQGLYRLYIEHFDKSPQEAAKEVLTAVCRKRGSTGVEKERYGRKAIDFRVQ